MTDTMKRVLSRAASFGAPASMNRAELIEATERGWIEYAGNNQNCMTPRYRITEQGTAALAVEG